jgi:hypothetical protein
MIYYQNDYIYGILFDDIIGGGEKISGKFFE